MSDAVTARKDSWGTRLTLMFCSCDSNALGAVITPILATLAVVFPNENVNLLVSIPPLLIIFIAPLTGRLAYYVSRKTLLTIGQILYVIGGVGAAWFTSFVPILVMRVILGIGCGIVYPIVPTIISQLYKGHERAQMLGWANAVGGGLAMVISIAAGVLATIGWHWPFYLDCFFIIVTIMQIIFLPKMPADKDNPDFAKSQAKAKREGKKIKIGHRAMLCWLLIFVAFVLGMVFLLNVSKFIVEEALGDSVAAGFASSFATGASVVLAFTFPFAYKKLGRWSGLIPLAMAALGFMIFYYAHSIIAVYVACIIYGCYLGYLIPYCQNTISCLVHPVKRGLAMSILTAALFAGEAASTPFVALADIVVGTSTRAQFGVLAVGFVIIFCVMAIYLVASRKTASKDYLYTNVADADDEPDEEAVACSN